MATAIPAVTAGTGSIYYFITTDTNRDPLSLAKRLGKEGIAHFKDCLRDILLNAWPQGRCSE